MLIQRDTGAGVLKLSQEAFILEMLRRFKFDDITSAPTPAADAGAEASMTEADLPQKEEDKMDILPFQELLLVVSANDQA